MKKFIFSLIACVLLLTACDQQKETSNQQGNKQITVGVAAGPYGDMFKYAIAPGLEKKGYKVTIKEFSDYVQPNLALANKDIDVNLFQHLVYLNYFKAEHKLDLSPVGFVPTAGAGVFSNKIKSFSELKAGDQVTISNDPVNEARALRILQAAKLITLDPNAKPEQYTVKNVIENPYQVEIVPIEAPQTPRSLDTAVLSVVNGNYAIGAGLDLNSALYTETLEPDLKNLLAVRTADLDAELGKDLIDVLKSDDFKKIIEDPKHIFHSFQKPDYQLFK